MRLFLCGDVMLGRGVDQVLPQPCDPTLYEDYVTSALEYVRLAERVNGPIARPVAPSYVWGVALAELERARPDARIINLETSVTRGEAFEPKGINYRMSPENAVCLRPAHIDCCVLANNHVLDWGRAGLRDTLSTLRGMQIKTAGAGGNHDEAAAPAILPMAAGGRTLVYSFASPTSGTPKDWAATTAKSGVNLLADLSYLSTRRVIERIDHDRRPGDIVVVSIHWGGNWGYEVPEAQRRFAHDLIEEAGVSVVHGHSSHHPKGIELFRSRLILYGCGDFINDYEGIAGHEDYRGDLVLMYFADLAADGALAGLEIVPLQLRQLRLIDAREADADWLFRVLTRESARLGTELLSHQGRFSVRLEKPFT